jgi:hypothetical protein
MFLGIAMDAATDPDFTSTGKLRIAIALPTLILIYYGSISRRLRTCAQPACSSNKLKVVSANKPKRLKLLLGVDTPVLQVFANRLRLR